VLQPLTDFQADIQIGVAYPKELNTKVQGALMEVCEQVRSVRDMH